ncbi:MAG TPA: C10 family peptidase, partial [Bacteroidales bacterium]|nr:C10 family peptidase [Bacteroidales bacterium]
MRIHAPIFFILLSLTVSGFAQAPPATYADDADAAALFLDRMEPGQSRRQASDCRVVPWNPDSEGALKAYVFPADQGFLLTDAEQRVLAFSPRGSLPDPKTVAGHPALDWLRWAGASITETTTGPEHLDDLARTSGPAVGRGNVRPLLKSSWDQYCGYNDLCPADSLGSCGRTCAGDLAVAMAQVMRYFAYPTTGNSMLTYTLPVYGDITAIFSQANYDYPSMPDHPFAPHPEVNELIFHCGAAMRTAYGIDYSDAELQQVPHVLRQFFLFDQNVHYLHSAGWDPALWKEAVKDELELGRPVIYEGRGTTKH